MTINDSGIPKDKSPIFLVHGTWGRGSLRLDPPTGRRQKRWFDEGSRFRLRLDEALKKASMEGTVRAFLWSGANSVTARDRAAASLSQELEKSLRAPDTRPIVIAHSHGGNVVLCALKYLKSGTERLRFISLATPFLNVYINDHAINPMVDMIQRLVSFILMMIAVKDL
jgi:hypothetical protein